MNQQTQKNLLEIVRRNYESIAKDFNDAGYIITNANSVTHSTSKPHTAHFLKFHTPIPHIIKGIRYIMYL